MGDFNDILDANEKRGGNPQPMWLINGFTKVVETSGIWVLKGIISLGRDPKGPPCGLK